MFGTYSLYGSPCLRLGTALNCYLSFDFALFSVLSGRGGGTNLHPGNRYYRDLIFTMRKDYDNASKSKKPLVSKRIVAMVRENGGRFLSKNRNDGLYYDIGDAAAREKTSQALRHRTFEMRRDKTVLSSLQKQQQQTSPSLNNENVAIMKQNASSASTETFGHTQGILDMRQDSHYIRDGRLMQHPFGALGPTDVGSFPMMNLAVARNSSPFGAAKPILDATGGTLEGLQSATSASFGDSRLQPSVSPVVGGSPYGMVRPTIGLGTPLGRALVGAEGEAKEEQQEVPVMNRSNTESADEAVDVLATVAMMARPVPLPAAADLVAENEAEGSSDGQDDGETVPTRETAPVAQEEWRPTPKQWAIMDLEAERRARAAAGSSYLLPPKHPSLNMMGMAQMETPQVAQQLRLDMMARQQFLEELELSRAMQLHRQRQQRLALEEQQHQMAAMAAAGYSAIPTPDELPPRLG